MYMDREDMADWAYRESNPGFERETGLTASDLEDCDPELAVLVADRYAHDNARRRARNQRTREAMLQQDNDDLRALLNQHGITPPEPREN